MRKEFVMRGKTPSNNQETLNFSGFKPGMAYKLVEFDIYPSTNIGGQTCELSATITAAKTYEDPSNPNFNNEGLIGTSLCFITQDSTAANGVYTTFESIVNDTFLITQNLILAVIDSKTGAPMDVNWQCRFEPVKMAKAEEAVANYKQFTISDE
jgi:hypothetical protein